MDERFERLLALRGDPVNGLAVTAWTANLKDFDPDTLHRGVIAVVRKLLIPDWAAGYPEDRRPQLALEAAEAWLQAKTPETQAHAKAQAQACTAAKNETFGKDHRVPEAARACAWACGAADSTDLFDGLVATEKELLARIALVAEYKKAPEQRKAIVHTLRDVITPPVDPAAAAPSAEPVPYAASGHFAVGQKLLHKVFGNLVVTGVVDKLIDVQLEDGTTKRLAHKPK